MKSKKTKKSTFDSISNLKGLMSGIKVISILAMIVHSFILLAIVVLSTYSIIKFRQVGIEQTLNNEGVVEFISFLNGYDVVGTKEYLLEYQSINGMIVLEILIPMIAGIAVYTLYNLACSQLIKFTKNVKDNKSLFKKEKLDLLKNVRNLLIFAFVCNVFISNFSIFVSMIFVLLLEMIVYLFNHCVNNKEIEVKEN